MRRRNGNSEHAAITVDVIVDGKPVTLRHIPKPMFARSLGLVDTIGYPDGELASVAAVSDSRKPSSDVSGVIAAKRPGSRRPQTGRTKANVRPVRVLLTAMRP